MRIKVCTSCGKELPATTEYFYRKKNGKYGLTSHCKPCQNNVMKTPKHLGYRRGYHHKRMENDPEYAERHRERAREDRCRKISLYDWTVEDTHIELDYPQIQQELGKKISESIEEHFGTSGQ